MKTVKKPQILNIIFKSLIWLKKNNFDEECQYLLQNYNLTEDQRRIYDGINSVSIYGVVEGKAEGQHG